MNCPCGSNQTFAQCCEPFIKGTSFPPTAEKLMRARYSAYTVGEIHYIKNTLAPESRSDFDIKESRKKTREQVRHTLTQIGFIKLQNSVWIYPYDCEDLISLLKDDFMLGKDLLYVIVEKLENDYSLRKFFKLIK